jgi:hypothetical protein
MSAIYIYMRVVVPHILSLMEFLVKLIKPLSSAILQQTLHNAHKRRRNRGDTTRVQNKDNC